MHDRKTDAIHILRADPAEGDHLKAIMVASKAYWGYPAEWIDPWATKVQVRPEFIRQNEVYKAVRDGETLGWYALCQREDKTILDDLWVAPQAIGQGIGHGLFAHALQRAAALGVKQIEIEADPNAAGFYEKMGAQVIGEAVSEWERSIPLLLFSLSAPNKIQP